MTMIERTLPPVFDQNYSIENESNEMTIVVSNVGYHIFSKFSLEEVFLSRSVCKRWKQQIDSDQQLWGFFLDRDLQLNPGNPPRPQDYLLGREYLEDNKKKTNKNLWQTNKTSDKVFSLEIKASGQASIAISETQPDGELKIIRTLHLSRHFKSAGLRDLNPNKIAVSKDETCLATCDNRRIFYWNLKNQKQRKPLIVKKTSKSSDEFLAISNNGKLVLINSAKSSSILNVAENTLTSLKKDTGKLTDILFSSTTDEFLTINDKRICTLWDNTGQQCLEVSDNITSAIFSRDGKSIIAEVPNTKEVHLQIFQYDNEDKGMKLQQDLVGPLQSRQVKKLDITVKGEKST